MWTPADRERVVPIIGAAGHVGTSTVALALALACDGPTRVVECCSVSASGLAGASTSELGLDATGWRQGKRGCVLLERTSELFGSVEDLPEPTRAEHDDQLTILDIGWDASQLAIGRGWLTATVQRSAVLIVVTAASIPGFRRLEAALELLTASAVPTATTTPGLPPALGRVVLVVVGPPRRKWAGGVEQSGGNAVRDLMEAGRLVEVPYLRGLAATGLDSRPFPDALTRTAARLVPLIDLPAT